MGCLQLNALAQFAELNELTDLFERHGISVLVLKGVLLAKDLYGDLGARQSWDIDLVISKGDIKKVDTLFQKLGYQRQKLTPKQMSQHLKNAKDFVYTHPNKHFQVELHWRLFQDWDCFDPFKVPHSKVEVGGQVFKVLAPEYNLIYLCTHGAESYWARAQWAQDIYQLLEKYGPSLDWALIWKVAAKYDLTGALEEGLGKSHQFKSLPKYQPYAWRFKAWWRRLLLRKRLKNRVRVIISLLVPRTQDYEIFLLPDKLYGLYYFLRPFGALKRNRVRSQYCHTSAGWYPE
ncbi:MAG: nucleotidyltransferase family protein [Deltaproteobacteria bacterium]|nr:nucleotidyltransferase family protein [Deltaproteobacteria bacterium]